MWLLCIHAHLQHAPFREFLSWGVQDRHPENSMDHVYVLSPQLILQFTGGGPMVLLQRKLYSSKDPKGSNIFQASSFFQGKSYPPCGSAHEQRGSKTDRNFNRSLNMWTD